MSDSESRPVSTSPGLERGLGLWQATALNIANMVGIGPFITIPAFIAAMNGPQAMIGWVIAALLVMCDGLVWSELGAALPGSGGTYHFLKKIFGEYSWGKIIPFLFIWQFLVSGALELASGYVGALDYLKYAVPSLPVWFEASGIWGGTRWVAAISAFVVTLLLCQRIRNVGVLGLVLCAGTIATVLTVIAAGLSHFDAQLLTMPDHAFDLNSEFAIGLGGAMLIAVYDYLGYFNVCHLGDEVRDPGKTIPRAVLLSILLVAATYLTMNISIIAVLPWQEAMQSKNVAADFMERLFGRSIAVGFTYFILWTSIACVFAATLAYSRIPYAAALGGDFFAVFGKLHPTARYPWVSLVVIGCFTAIFCFFSLQQLIEAAVCVRIVIQFIGQIVALHLLRRQPGISMPFRMWFYPVPSVIALIGWLYVLGTASHDAKWLSLGVLVTGFVAYFVWKGTFGKKQSPMDVEQLQH